MARTKKLKLPLTTILFIVIPIIVVVVAIFKLANTNEKTVYARIKIAQGYWWASTKDPAYWIPRSIKKGDKEYGFFNQPIAEIEEVRYYPGDKQSPEETNYNVILIAKLQASYNKSNKTYTFKRADLTVGSPVEIDTSKTLITGVVMQISDTPLQDNYIEKTVTLTKYEAYFWEYSNINIGDTYFDGVDKVFEITGKNLAGSSSYFTRTTYNSNGVQKIIDSATDKKYRIILQAKIKVIDEDGRFLYGEKVVQKSSEFSLSTADSQIKEYFITSLK